jgi:DNA repair exonuclease SbcCD nuclease subunit
MRFTASMLGDAGIPVMIEGNHDSHEVTNRFSWLRSPPSGLPQAARAGPQRWCQDSYPGTRTQEGSFIDIGGVRVLARHGMERRSRRRFRVLLISSNASQRKPLQHHDASHRCRRAAQPSIPALSIAKLNELRPSIDYLALGHTHKNFEIGDWAYNPASRSLFGRRIRT